MMMKSLRCLAVLFLGCGGMLFAQDNFIIQNKSRTEKVRFQLINNLIVFPVEVNGVTLSFLLDTGVTKPMIFNILNISDSLNIKNTEPIFLKGLGEGHPVKALKSRNNVLKIGDAIKLKQDLYAIYDSRLSFAPKLGVPVSGIIGYDILKDFIVEINYSSKFMKFYEPEVYKHKKCNGCELFNLEFHNNKPLIGAHIELGNQSIPVKLLIDSGGSDALWLFGDTFPSPVSRANGFEDFLGYGLSGSVYGKRSRIDGFSLKGFGLKHVNVAFPDAKSISYKRVMKGRNGSISGEILRRFNIVFDYKNARVSFRKNRNFNDKFFYNKSGIVLEYGGYRLVKEKDKDVIDDTYGNNFSSTDGSRVVLDTRYKFVLKPAYTVVKLREGSPAKEAGLILGDVILSVNGKPAHRYSLQQITHMFSGEDEKYIKLKVDRKGRVWQCSFKLKDLLDKKSQG